MGTYVLNWPYEAYRDGTRYGPWAVGAVVNLDEADAEWVERDSPGALSKSVAAGPADTPVPALGARPRVNGDPDNAEVAAEAKRRVDAEADARQGKPVAFDKVELELVDVTEHVAGEPSEVDDDDAKKPARNRGHKSAKNR